MAKLNIRGVETHVDVWNTDGEITLVALHGFTGSTATWRNLANSMPSVRIVAIDLMGHGKTGVPLETSRFSMCEQLKDVEAIFDMLQLTQFSLLGYSMGGRIALSYVIAYPHRVEKLILESASPGLQTAEERSARITRDEVLAAKIEVNGLESFVNAWENISLFETQKKLPDAVRLEIRSERLSQCITGLAGSLRGIGTGKQPSNWSDLTQVENPVLLITGSLDEKFCRIASEMKMFLKNAENVTVNDAGHAIHVENPAEFATIVGKYLFS
ncbi:MAG: 2-succinyl-6-hydroxy-2,4-cyclohexadiene-1-carboxylate synthase [Lysinibacillus sp.]